MELILVNIGFVLINLICIALNLKIYTEYFKDKSADKRGQKTFLDIGKGVEVE